ncbi:MAG: helix-hairpin-helix domain-containing protein [Rhizobacter sp.]
MFKKILAAVLALSAAFAFAAVDANKGTQAELEAVKGIGPAIATKIIDERKKGSFKDWQDMVDRVKGVGEGNAAKFSADGLTVNGAAFAGAPAKPAAAKKDDKPAVKKDATPAAAATATTPAAKPAAMSADDKKAAAKKEKEDKKAAAAKEKEDKKAAAAKEKEDKKAAKAAKAEAAKKAKADKAAAAAASASAAKK